MYSRESRKQEFRISVSVVSFIEKLRMPIVYSGTYGRTTTFVPTLTLS
jgi:hypothetical protein